MLKLKAAETNGEFQLRVLDLARNDISHITQAQML